MTRANRIIGLPVVYSARRIGNVLSVPIRSDGHALAGVVVQCGLNSPRFIAREHIALLGRSSVMVDAPAKERPPLFCRPGRVRDTGGLRVGWATDMRLDEKTLTVDAVEVSFGPIDDMLYGRRWMQDFTLDSASGDIVIPWFSLECLEHSERRTQDANVDISGNGGGKRARPGHGGRADEDAAGTQDEAHAGQGQRAN